MADNSIPLKGHGSVQSEDIWGKPPEPREERFRPSRAFGTHRAKTLLCLSFLWVSGQLPFYMYGSTSPYVYREIGESDKSSWYIIAFLFVLAAVCPFLGSVADLIGRRHIALLGALLIVIGMILCSTCHRMSVFIAGMALTGAGSAICETISLTVVAEQSPARERGKYATIMVFSIIPFAPAILWAQLIASNMGWRYIGCLCASMAAIAFILTAIFFHPPPTLVARGRSKWEMFRRIDFVGGFFFIGGTLLFTCGLQFGTLDSWGAARTCALLVLGIAMILVFVVWEVWMAKYPMLPARLRKSPKILLITLCITFVAGAQFNALLIFFPTQSYNQFNHDAVAVGIKGTVVGLCLIFGACIVLMLLYTLNGYNRALLVGSCAMMTAGVGSLAVIGTENESALWGPLIIGSLGIGGIYVPSIIIIQMVCPDELLGVATAATITVRILGGAVGFAIYYSVYLNKFKVFIVQRVTGTMLRLGVRNVAYITQAVHLIADANIEQLRMIPDLANQTNYDLVVKAGQLAYADSYRYVYLMSIAFGVVATISAFCLGDLESFMDNHVAIVVE